MESTTKRLEITQILADLIKELDINETDIGIYLSLGTLKAQYENPKFNMADEIVIRALNLCYGKEKKYVQDLYNKLGDLGDVAFEMAKESTSKLILTQVYNQLWKLAESFGAGSQENKVSRLAGLLKTLDRLSAKFITRIVIGTTRLGFSELTIIDALSQVIDGTKNHSELIESKYSMYPDIGSIAKKIKQKGLKGIQSLQIETGVPILAQKCQRLSSPTEILEKMPAVWAEFKYDGTRVQLHMDKSKIVKADGVEQTALFAQSTSKKEKYLIKTYTRNQNETTHQFPDICKAADKQVKAESVILDGEAIGYNPQTGEFLPLQDTMERKRKHNVADAIKKTPLKYFVFDILYLNGKSLMDKPLTDRRKLLDQVMKKGDGIEVDEHLLTSDLDELEEFFEEAKDRGLEGVIAKNPASPYQAGARSFSWVKLKKMDTKLLSDTIDCVVLGYFYGKGMRTEFGIGKCLMGIYDSKSDTYKTICKLGTGLKEVDLTSLKQQLDRVKTTDKPTSYEVGKKFTPDVWVKPAVVLELGADEISQSEEHSAKYALRFPRLIKFRPDKSATDTTNLKEITQMAKSQKRGQIY